MIFSNSSSTSSVKPKERLSTPISIPDFPDWSPIQKKEWRQKKKVCRAPKMVGKRF